MIRNTRQLIKKHNIRLVKSLGQNFLIDEKVTKRIVDTAELSNADTVIEIGPGIGNMTVELAGRVRRVIAFEIDRRLIPALQDNLGGALNVDIINKDIMDVDIGTIQSETREGRLKVVANLPYYITTPIIMRFLEESNSIDSMVFMVQKEVASRMTAKPGGKDYGALTVAVQYYSLPEMVFDVAPHCFIPQPGVDSTIIKLVKNEKPPVEVLDRKLFFKVVRSSFGQRRKTLVNALYNSGAFGRTKEEIKQILRYTGIHENARGETLSMKEFAEISNKFSVQG